MDVVCEAESLVVSVQDTGKELCRGAHSRIVEVVCGGVRCRAKRIEKSSTASSAEKLREGVANACVALARLRHPNIVQFLGINISPTDSSASIITEYLLYSLALVLERYGSPPETLMHSLLRETSSALAYLHELSPAVSHGHLIPTNVLLTEDFTAKLSDVGVSRTVRTLRNISRESAVYLPAESPGTAADVYAFGAVMVHVIGGTHPATLITAGSSDKSLMKNIGVVERHPLCGIVKDCLNSDPTKRPSASQIQTRISIEVTKFPLLSMESRLAHIQSMKGRGSPSHTLTGTRRTSFSPKRMIGGMEDDRCLGLVIENEALKLETEELRVANRGLRTALDKQMKFVSAHDHEMAAKLMAKDQEIVARQQETVAQQALVKAAEDNVSAKEATNRGLTLQLRSLQDYLTSRAEPHLLNPKAQLKWKSCTDMPNGLIFGQAVTVKDAVYFGSGTSHLGESSNTPRILRYSPDMDNWSTLNDCPVVAFGMGCYLGELVLVGGAYGSEEGSSSITGDIHLLDETRQEWKQSLPPLLKPRMLSTVVSHTRGLVAIGGIVLDATHDQCLNSVEVYDGESSQWHRAAHLPLACIGMTSAMIGDTCYLLGGFTDTDFDQPTTRVFAASLNNLIQDAVGSQCGLVNGAPHEEHGTPVWSELVDSPRYASTAANLGNCLLTLGGSDERLEHKSGALHVFSPLTNSWIRIEDIPVSCFASAVVKLSDGDLLIIGGMGHDEEDALRSVHRGQLLLH